MINRLILNVVKILCKVGGGGGGIRLLGFKIRSYQELGKVRKILIFRYLIKRISALTFFISLQNKMWWWHGAGSVTKHFRTEKGTKANYISFLRASIRNSELA